MTPGVFSIPLAPHPSGVGEAPTALGNFVAGPENRLVASALKPLLDGSSHESIGLLIYGPHGSGKSHLALGLAAWWHQHFPHQQLLCATGLEFVQDYLAAWEAGRLPTWRSETRRVQLLILDDLTPIVGRRGAQIELLYALDDLEARGGHFLITARTLPVAWPGLLTALASRLSAALAIPLALPGTAARREIVAKLAHVRGIVNSKGALQQLADRLTAGVPELAAAISRLELDTKTSDRPIDDQAVDCLLDARLAERTPSLREIATQTARHFGVSAVELKGPLRRQSLVAARGVAMYLARELRGATLSEIGSYFGGRDHSTVLHGCRKTRALLKSDPATRHAVLQLTRVLRG